MCEFLQIILTLNLYLEQIEIIHSIDITQILPIKKLEYNFRVSKSVDQQLALQKS